MFSSTSYSPAVDDKLTPATARDIEICLSLALTSGSSLARSQAADVTAKIVAERLVAQLERSGFVIMRKPIPVGHPRRHSRRMPKDGCTLSDVLEPTLTVVCQPCGRREVRPLFDGRTMASSSRWGSF
jgi:hypothetical protein